VGYRGEGQYEERARGRSRDMLPRGGAERMRYRRGGAAVTPVAPLLSNLLSTGHAMACEQFAFLIEKLSTRAEGGHLIAKCRITV